MLKKKKRGDNCIERGLLHVVYNEYYLLMRLNTIQHLMANGSLLGVTFVALISTGLDTDADRLIILIGTWAGGLGLEDW